MASRSRQRGRKRHFCDKSPGYQRFIRSAVAKYGKLEARPARNLVVDPMMDHARTRSSLHARFACSKACVRKRLSPAASQPWLVSRIERRASPRLRAGHRIRVARPERFELPTFWFVARRSIQLSYGRPIRQKRGTAIRKSLSQIDEAFARS